MSTTAMVTLSVLGVGGASAAVWLGVFLVRFMVGLFLDHPMVILRLEPEPPEGELGAREPDVHFLGRDGKPLRGWFVRSARPTRRVIAFFHEYGADGEAWLRYLSALPAEGFHVFTFDFRGSGASVAPEGYRSFKWATADEVADADAALRYLRARGEAEGWQIAAFGASRGAAAMMMAAVNHPWLERMACEGMSSTMGSILSYTRRWARIYIPEPLVERMPMAVWRVLAHLVVVASENRERRKFPSLEQHLAELGDRHILFIYGERDALITPDHRNGILQSFSGKRCTWLLPRAGHLAGPVQFAQEYGRRLAEWFQESPLPRRAAFASERGAGAHGSPVPGETRPAAHGDPARHGAGGSHDAR